MIREFLEKNKNLHIIIVSIAVVIWFYSITGIINILTNNSKKLETYLGLLLISLLVLYLDDKKLDELHKFESSKEAAAVVASKANMMH